MTPRALAIFGGSFDPPHVAHLEIIRRVIGIGAAGRVVVVPCARHAFGKPLAPFRHRLAMCALTCDESAGLATASDVESRLGLSGYTVDTVEAIAAENPGVPLRLVVGADVLPDRARWRRWGDVARIAPPLIVARAGHDDGGEAVVPAPAGISSTEVRALIAAGSPPAGMLLPSVLDYIEAHRLYRRQGR